MPNKKATGALAVMNKLRDSQKQQSTIDRYIEKSKSGGKNGELNPIEQQLTKDESILEIDPSQITISSYKVDRIELTEESVQSLANAMHQVGQAQPCVVRRNESNPDKPYELIFGERRLKAATAKGLMLKAVVKDLSEVEAGLLLLSENKERKNNSDYELGEQLSELLEKTDLKQKDLTSIGFQRQTVSKLLSYRRLPDEIKTAIKDFQKVSATTAQTLLALSKDNESIPIIVEIADKIRSGKYGYSKVESYVFSSKRPKKESKDVFKNNKVYSQTGRHMFTWRRDNNLRPSIHFPKDIIKLVESGKIDENILSNKIMLTLENLMSGLHNDKQQEKEK